MQTVAEMPEYLRRSERLLSEDARKDVVDFLAVRPEAGVLIRGTGGIRKLRWAREGMGKSGGVRVIYYFHDERMPLYLLTLFGKGDKDNLTRAERNELAKLVKALVQFWRSGHE
jgi:hypothetical protein